MSDVTIRVVVKPRKVVAVLRPNAIKVSLARAGPQGPPGPAGAAGAPSDALEAENLDTVAIPAGGPVAPAAVGAGVVRASAAAPPKVAVGLATARAAPGFAAAVKTGGPLTLADWTDVTGATELSPGSPYFVAAAPGTLTATPPTTAGQVVQCVGTAASPDTLLVEIDTPYLL